MSDDIVLVNEQWWKIGDTVMYRHWIGEAEPGAWQHFDGPEIPFVVRTPPGAWMAPEWVKATTPMSTALVKWREER
jgi:hypothetical protein